MAVALITAAQVHGAEEYLCREESMIQFNYEGDTWSPATRSGQDAYRVMRSKRPKTAWEVTLEGHDLTVLCADEFNAGGWTRCEGLFTFVFRNNNRFMAIHDVPYTLQRMERAANDEYVPYIATGKCTLQ
jgi:hypothetical protein